MIVVLVAIAAFFIGFSKAGIGGTLSPFITVLMVLTLPADDAIGLLLPMLIVADLFTITAHWRQWSTPIVLRLLVGAIFGIALGSLVVGSISPDALRNLIAIAMLVFAAYYIVTTTRLAPRLALKHAWPAGFTGGLTSTVAHQGGPPVYMYLLTTDLAPRMFVATVSALFTMVNLLKVPAYIVAGLFDTELIASVWYAWFTIPIGVMMGRALVGRLDRETFDRIALTLLIAGAILILVT